MTLTDDDARKLIDEGDRVFLHIDAEGNVTVEGIVQHRPCATGDSWVIKPDNRPVVYVQQFHAMWKQP